MIQLPKSGKIKIGTLIKWNNHNQYEFNKLDKRTLDYIIMYCRQYIAIFSKLNQPIPYKALELLALLDIKCNQSYKFNNYNRDKNT